MSPISDAIKTTDSSLGKAAQTFIEKLPENIATVAGGVGGYGVGQGVAWGFGSLVGSTVIGGALYPIVFPVLTCGGIVGGAVYSYKFAKKVLKEDKQEKK